MNISEVPTWFDETVNSYPYTTITEQKWGQLDILLNWADQSLTGNYRWWIQEMAGKYTPGKYQFYFDNEQDYMLFLLKWK